MDSKHSFFRLARIALVSGLATQASAFWVLGCGKPVAVERVDPIVSPGTVSSHVHSIMGGNAFDWDLDYNQTQTSNCTTCGVSKDLSNYWVPTVYFRAANGSYISVEQVGGVNVYYQQRIDWTELAAGAQIQPFPPGFRMLAGDPSLRTPSNSTAQRAIEFACLPGRGEEGQPATPGFPARKCPGGLQARIRFPSCWDGARLDSPDHRAHVAYPAGMDNGACGAAHPVRLMALFYEVTWAVDRFDALREEGDQPFVLSTGDATGYGYHADFLNGWDTDLLRRAISDESCGDSARGDINLCDTFKPFLLDGDQQNACAMTARRRVDEPVAGVLSALPGMSTAAVSAAAPTAAGRRSSKAFIG